MVISGMIERQRADLFTTLFRLMQALYGAVNLLFIQHLRPLIHALLNSAWTLFCL